MKRIASMFTTLCLAILAAPTVAVPKYMVTKLGSLEGCTHYYVHINNNGEAVGYGSPLKWPDRPFYWSKSTGMVELHTLDGRAKALAVVGKDKIIGRAVNSRWQQFSVIWNKSGSIVSADEFINDVGEAYIANDFGVTLGATSLGNIMIFPDGREVYIFCPRNSRVNCINDRSWVAGVVGEYPFICKNDSLTRFLDVPDGKSWDISDMNDSGVVVGMAWDNQDHASAIKWDVNGHVHDLGFSGDAIAINEKGVIVGRSSKDAAIVAFPDGKTMELCSNGIAQTINDRGQIAGVIEETKGHFSPVIWTPIPASKVGKPKK